MDRVFNLTNIDRWFLVQIEELVRLEEKVAEVGITGLNAIPAPAETQRLCRCASGKNRACEAEIRKLRDQYDLHPVYKRVQNPRGRVRHRHRLHVLHL